MTGKGETRWFEALRAVLDDSHLWQAGEVAGRVGAAVSPLGLRATIWLTDYEQMALRALPEPGRAAPEPLPIDGSLAGRAFARVRSLRGDGLRWWVPMVNGTDRIGVVEFVAEADQDADFVGKCELLAGLIGHLITTTMPRGDHLDLVRRSQAMSTASELLWRMLPPLTVSCERAVISAALQPCYEVGGDGFDYALDGDTAYVAILDAVGKGVTAGVACAVALAAIRAARRAGGGLAEQARAADEALTEHFTEVRFVTAVLAELRLDTGRIRYLNAGHPAPLLLRSGRLVRELDAGRRLPLGLADPRAQVGEEALEPDDRLLLYTDGVTEARTPEGEFFGVNRLVGLVERSAAARLPAPETLRRLSHAVLDHQGGPPDDDATLLLVQWSAAAALDTVPTTKAADV
ncbi:putative magnesium/manganese-dependent protein phosphatase [Actinoplanes missouriensis 431]|uniref:Putative magnesium/manganese-dependent protein phosphatase n=1 Tax=Actinoplanes missouriensis (strain ATCC 14538 / DSM 43046 / CBS 188.64 / JCM 3121 / NBRC 102363 / NCIMB 12654 / NRRL B-3342 / UNCC 431) TaxID=512565 RepID=I0HDY8_ACTM4|nr:PP2C family protein-serine/threonine phosphatase [Actinoplanes missouriensis]BAL91225.1 putative magnesium/manganese-dependent protein phosphatase [Actinoplanes missouriensis 431]